MPRRGDAEREAGGHGERSVAAGTLGMALWDACAKIAERLLFRLLAERHGVEANPRVFVMPPEDTITPARTWARYGRRCEATWTAGMPW